MFHPRFPGGDDKAGILGNLRTGRRPLVHWTRDTAASIRSCPKQGIPRILTSVVMFSSSSVTLAAPEMIAGAHVMSVSFE